MVLSTAADILQACLVFAAIYVSQLRGDHDGQNHAAGRDFLYLWTASRLVEDGRTSETFDQDRFAAIPQQHVSYEFPLHFWS